MVPAKSETSISFSQLPRFPPPRVSPFFLNTTPGIPSPLTIMLSPSTSYVPEILYTVSMYARPSSPSSIAPHLQSSPPYLPTRSFFVSMPSEPQDARIVQMPTATTVNIFYYRLHSTKFLPCGPRRAHNPQEKHDCFSHSMTDGPNDSACSQLMNARAVPADKPRGDKNLPIHLAALPRP